MTRIEFLRREQNMTQRALAEKISNWACNIAQIERGHRKPWPRIRKDIAEALGVDEQDLFDRAGYPLEVQWEIPARTAAI